MHALTTAPIYAAAHGWGRVSITSLRAGLFLLLVVAAAVVGTGAVSAASGGGGDDPCQDPRALGAGCPVCWEVYEPYQIGKLHCTRTDAPS